jgi:hypothetical protein
MVKARFTGRMWFLDSRPAMTASLVQDMEPCAPFRFGMVARLEVAALGVLPFPALPLALSSIGPALHREDETLGPNGHVTVRAHSRTNFTSGIHVILPSDAQIVTRRIISNR